LNPVGALVGAAASGDDFPVDCRQNVPEYRIQKQLGNERMSDATYNLNGSFRPTMKRFADLDGPDFFPTPRWATFALIENEKFKGEIWECACGDGTMSRALEETGQPVRSSEFAPALRTGDRASGTSLAM
jgi:hypothetical protein